MTKTDKDYFKALYDMAKVINASLEPEQVLGQIVQCVAEAMEVKSCSLRVLDSRKERLLMGASWGLSEGYLRKGPVLVKESGLDKNALRGKTVWLENAQTDKDFQYQDKAKAEGIKSILVVPLMIGEKPIGVLRVYSGEIRRFDADEVQFLEAVANLSAIALENARLHQALQTDYDRVGWSTPARLEIIAMRCAEEGGLHIDRVARRDCDHSHPRESATPRIRSRETQGAPPALCQQYQAAWHGAPHVYERHRQPHALSWARRLDNPTKHWMTHLSDDYARANKIRFCPAAPEETPWRQRSSVREGFGTASQAWNWRFNGTNYGGSYAINGWFYWADPPYLPHDPVKVFRHESAIRLPSRTPIFADSVWVFVSPSATDVPSRDLF